MYEVVVLSIDKLYGELICARLKSSTPEIHAEAIVPHPRFVGKLLDDIGSRTVLVDLQSVSVCKSAFSSHSNTPKRVLLVPEATPEHVDVAKKINASSIIQTSMDAELLNYALLLAIKGGSFYPASLWDRALFKGPYSRDGGISINGVEVSGREKAIIDALVTGSSNKIIAEDLGLTEGTVKVYLSKLCKKFGVSNRTQLVLKALNEANPA